MKKLILTLITILLALSVSSAYAQECTPTPPPTPNPEWQEDPNWDNTSGKDEDPCYDSDAPECQIEVEVECPVCTKTPEAETPETKTPQPEEPQTDETPVTTETPVVVETPVVETPVVVETPIVPTPEIIIDVVDSSVNAERVDSSVHVERDEEEEEKKDDSSEPIVRPTFEGTGSYEELTTDATAVTVITSIPESLPKTGGETDYLFIFAIAGLLVVSGLFARRIA